MASQRSVCVIGGGLTGALMANYLARAGWRVDVYERRADPRVAGFVGGRSINLAISERGLDALRRVGLAEPILALALPMRGRMIHDLAGRQTLLPYDKDPARCINSISRGGLNIALLDAAERHGNVRLHFERTCVAIDLEAPAARLRDERTGEELTASADLLIGADGAYSTVRGVMQRLERFDYSQAYLEHGYKELHVPPTAGGAFQMEPNALHIWPRRAFMMIALPNTDRSFTCTCFWPFAGPNGFERLRTADETRSYFREQFRDAEALMPTLEDDYQRNPTGALVTVRCAPWHFSDRVVLIGDAAHAIVPFYGQGMNAGFEDCVELDHCLRGCAGARGAASELGAALAEYSRRRRPNGDAIADLALRNFIEMRDHSGKRMFRLKKAVERSLHEWWPGYTPLYTLISFTTVPYAEAAQRARRQDRGVLLTLLALLLLVVALAVWAT